MFCRHPFQDESPLAIANARYNLPSTPQRSEKLQDLTHWLLAQDPRNRPNAMQVLGLIENFKDCILPLPSPVLEKKEQYRRLYERRPPSRAPSLPASFGHGGGGSSSSSAGRRGSSGQPL